MYLTTTQVSQKLGISKDRVKRLIQEGTLPSLPTNPDSKRQYFKVDEKAVRAYKASLKGTPSSPSLVVAATEGIPLGYVSAKDAAQIAGTAENTLYGRVAAGKLRSIKVGSKRYFLKDDLSPRGSSSVIAPISTPAVGLVARLASIEASIATLTQRLNDIVAALGGL